MAWGAHAARKHAGQQVLESLVPSRVAVGAPADRFINRANLDASALAQSVDAAAACPYSLPHESSNIFKAV
jgi:hypothetical protein